MSRTHNIMLGTAGHVDHGKTALVKLLTGCDTDTLPAEKQRGLTIELGFAPCRMRDERIVGIVDVPGHVDFIRHMVAGAHGIDVVMFVVAADDGVMPQTREHLDLLTLMGVRRGVVALTKIDLVDGESRPVVIEEVRGFVRGTFLEGAAICPLSNITGEGLDGFLDALNAAVLAAPSRPVEGLARMWIERVFPVKGFGAVVSGIPVSGEIHVGDRLEVVGAGVSGRVRRLEVYGQESPIGRAGECVAINLTDVDAELLSRGLVLAQPGSFTAVTAAEAQLALLPHVGHALKDYAEAHVHVGTAEAMAHVVMLEGRPLEPGGTQRVQLRLREPLGVAAGDRFAIRANLGNLAGGRVTTIGGGRVIGTGNVKLRRNRPEVLSALSARAAALDLPADWCELMLRESASAMSLKQLAKAAQMPLDRVRTIARELVAAGKAVSLAGGKMLHVANLQRAGRTVATVLETFLSANPSRLGLRPADLAAQTGLDRKALEAALEGMVRAGQLVRQQEVIAPAGRKARVAPELDRAGRLVEESLRSGRLSPPDLAELAARLHLPAGRVEQALALLSDRGQVVRLDERVAMHREAVEAAKRVALELFAKASGFSTMEFRDALGVSRKFAVPLLDYFDTIKLTVRQGNRRTPGAAARGLMKES